MTGEEAFVVVLSLASIALNLVAMRPMDAFRQRRARRSRQRELRAVEHG